MARPFDLSAAVDALGPEDLEGIGDVIENDDGSASILPPMGDEEPEPIEDFYENLAEKMSANQRTAFTMKLCEAVDRDRTSREKRDKQQAEGMKRSGLDTSGATPAFENASRVNHPILAECSVDYAARVIKELLPVERLVKYTIKPELINPQNEAKARRKLDHMNWQLLRESRSFRSEMEKLFSQQPMGGVQYMRIWWDADYERFEFQFYPVDWAYIPYGARSFYAARRKTFLEPVGLAEYEDRIAAGIYREVDIIPTTADNEKTKSEESADRVEGKEEEPSSEDGDRKLYLSMIMERLPKGIDPLCKSKGPCPYICTLDPDTNELLELRRNWEENDKKYEPIDWFIEFPFIPWRGSQAIGIPDLISGLSAAMTGALRAILDSALVNTMPTLIKLKGRPGGGNSRLNATGVHEIDGAGAEDVNKVFKQLQFNPPSTLLFEILGFLDRTARGVVRTSLEEMADQNTNVPVGTQLSRVEQGMMTFSSIFARQHEAMGWLLRSCHKLSRIYIQKPVSYDPEDPDQMAYPQDYKGHCEMVPVSDPRIFSESQRLAQMQAVDAIDIQNPGLINKVEKVRRQLSLLRVPDFENLIVKPPTPQQANQAAENVAMSMGQPAMAFPFQDHLAHLQSLLSFMEDPILGANPIIEPTFLPAAVNHVKEHLLYFYIDLSDQIAKKAAGFDPTQIVDPTDHTMVRMMDGLVAASTNEVHQMTMGYFEQALPIIYKAMQKVSELQAAARQAALQDPAAIVMGQEVERKKIKDKMDDEFRKMEGKAKGMTEMKKIEAKGAEIQTVTQAKVKINTDDNLTAIAIAEGETKLEAERLRGDTESRQFDQAKTAAEMQLEAETRDADRQGAESDREHSQGMEKADFTHRVMSDRAKQQGEASDRDHSQRREKAEFGHQMITEQNKQAGERADRDGAERDRRHGQMKDKADFGHQRNMDVAGHEHQVEMDRAEQERKRAADKAGQKDAEGRRKIDSRKADAAVIKANQNPNPTPTRRPPGSNPNPKPKK